MPDVVTPEERSAHLTAISTKQAAMIGLVGVLLAAVISVVAGVISARIAGDEAARTTALQLSGETERSKAEFLNLTDCTYSIANGHQPTEALNKATFGDVWRIDAANSKMIQAMKSDMAINSYAVRTLNRTPRRSLMRFWHGRRS
jgi:hypothetical protein